MVKNTFHILCILLILSLLGGCKTRAVDLKEEYYVAKLYANKIFPDSLLRVFQTGITDTTLISCNTVFKYPSLLNEKVNRVHSFPWQFVENHVFDNAAEYHSIKDTISRFSTKLIDTGRCFDINQASIYEQNIEIPDKPVFIPVHFDSKYSSDYTTISQLPKEAELFIDKIGYQQLIYDKEAEGMPYLRPEIGHGYESGAAFMDDSLWASFWVIVW